ncbi:VOC family protein [Aestuariivirga sp.]|uniref:VOC family protein n=1 Tax=Aestuariivirga sp. TaxID=2650926 RepID=UPI0039E2604B
MFDYVTLGSNDIARSRKFYDAAMAALGHTCNVAEDYELGYGTPGGGVPLWIVRPHMAVPATWGNGTMLALEAESRAAVDAFHAAAVAAGGIDEGKPGLRTYGPNFYACYVRDPDGNKLSALCRKPE